MLNEVLKSTKIAFSSWWSWLGVTTFAWALFNICVRVATLEVSEIFTLLLKAYQTIFYIPIDWLLFFLPFKLSPWIKDFLVIWSLITAVVLRTNAKAHNPNDYARKFGLWGSFTNPEWRRKVTYRNFRIDIVLNFYHPFFRYLLGFFIWPNLILSYFRKWPYILKATSGELESVSRFFIYSNEKEKLDYEYYFDFRLVFLLHILVGLAVLVCFVVLNGLGAPIQK